MKIITFTVTLTFSLASVFAQTEVEFYPSADCVVGFHDGENSANENAGSATHFSSFWQPAWTGVGENGGYGLIRFDLASIPSGSVINSATLSLHAFGDDFTPFLPDGHAGANACWLQRITEDWEEYTATWNTKPDMTATGQIAVPASTDPYEDYTIDIASFVQDMVDFPSNNFGFAIKLQDESPTRGLMFHSSDVADEGEWPQLTVVYSDPVPVIDMHTDAFTMQVFPNPTMDIITINLPEHPGAYLIQLYNLQGEQVISSNYTGQSSTIDVSMLAEGMYTVVATQMESGLQASSMLQKQ